MKAGGVKNLCGSGWTEETAGIIDDCVALGLARIGKVNDLTLKQYLARIDKIRRPVARHHALDGSRGYYNVIRKFFPWPPPMGRPILSFYAAKTPLVPAP